MDRATERPERCRQEEDDAETEIDLDARAVVDFWQPFGTSRPAAR